MTVVKEMRQLRGPIPVPSEKTVAVVGRIRDGGLAGRGHARILQGEEITKDTMMTVLETEVGIGIGIGTIDMIETGENKEKEAIRLMMIETSVVVLRVDRHLDVFSSFCISNMYTSYSPSS